MAFGDSVAAAFLDVVHDLMDTFKLLLAARTGQVLLDGMDLWQRSA